MFRPVDLAAQYLLVDAKRLVIEVRRIPVPVNYNSDSLTSMMLARPQSSRPRPCSKATLSYFMHNENSWVCSEAGVGTDGLEVL